jgi:nucleoside-diphosphate-sugar epimerase
MVSDGVDVSSPELVRRIAAVMGRRVRLLPIPVAVLRLAGGLLGRAAAVRRLCESLTVDLSDTRARLGWEPVLDLDAALTRTVAWYRSRGGAP